MVEVGQNLGRYRIESPLGAGGMGEVFRAWDSTLRRWVALKVVARDATGRAERLLAEARAVATLKHPNVVSVFDVGEVDGVAFVSMDLIVGKTLRDYIGDESVTAEKKQSWLLQIAGALSAAHRAGLVHRDTKPENVMIGEDGQAHVLDFGIAKSFGIDVVGPTQHSDETAPAQTHLTGEGRIIGTPAYMAPEQLAGGPPSPLWDQYAFGVVAYELLTGKHPRIAGLIGANGRVKPADEVAPGVPSVLAEVASHAMAPTQEQRYASMDDVVLALGGNVSGSVARIQSLPPPTFSRPPPPVSTNTPLAKGIGVQDTLPTAVQMPHPPRAPLPGWIRTAAFVVLMLALLGGGVVVGSKWSSGTDVAQPQPSVSAAPSASWTSPVASTVAPPPSASVVAPPSAIVVASTATPTATVKPPPPPPPPVRKPLDVRVRPMASLQYPMQASGRIVSMVQSQIKSCIAQHPPATIPATMSIKLELWNIGDLDGKVRSVDAREPPALEQCFREALEPLSFGPPADPKFPPGAIFIAVDVSAP